MIYLVNDLRVVSELYVHIVATLPALFPSTLLHNEQLNEDCVSSVPLIVNFLCRKEYTELKAGTNKVFCQSQASVI
jgi:hypothetical protein